MGLPGAGVSLPPVGTWTNAGTEGIWLSPGRSVEPENPAPRGVLRLILNLRGVMRSGAPSTCGGNEEKDRNR